MAEALLELGVGADRGAAAQRPVGRDDAVIGLSALDEGDLPLLGVDPLEAVVDQRIGVGDDERQLERSAVAEDRRCVVLGVEDLHVAELEFVVVDVRAVDRGQLIGGLRDLTRTAAGGAEGDGDADRGNRGHHARWPNRRPPRGK